MKRKILIILLSVIVLCSLFVLPIFAETQDELKQIFVTREEWNKWINDDCGHTNKLGSVVGMSIYLRDLEIGMQSNVQEEVKKAMIKREMKLPTESS